MILTGLRLKNFRQYKGLQELAFAAALGKTTTVIMGQNGAGKTNLFQALNWCLYGKGMEGKGALLTKGLAHEERAEGGFVEVHFRHEGFRFIARRDIKVDGPSESTGDLELSELSAEGKSKRAAAPIEKMNTILPSDARQYFFFDGERIDEMSRPGHEEQVREAIRSVLKLKVLERTVSHLDDVEAEFAQAVKKTATNNREVQELVDFSENLKLDISALKERRTAKEEERAAAVRQLDELSAKLRSLDALRELMKEETQYSERLRSASRRYRETLDAVGELIARGGPAMVISRLREASALLNDKRKRGEIPSNIRETLIDDLLGHGSCICERPLDNAARDALLRRKEATVSSAAEEAIMQATGQIAGLESIAIEVPDKLAQLMKSLAAAREEMDDCHRRLGELRDRLEAGFDDDVGALESARRKIEGRVGDIQHELGSLETTLVQKERQQSEIRDELQKLEVRSETVRRDIRRYELARDASEAAAQVLKVFAEEMRRRIEAEADRIFKDMVWKAKQFDSVRILEDYRLDVFDRFGASALNALSAGERQLLSLAFIVAMASVTGEEAPLVIDTPFGRISEEPLHNVCTYLPQLAGQLVLLVTDRELDDHATKLLEPYVGKEYELLFDDESGHSMIVSVTR